MLAAVARPRASEALAAAGLGLLAVLAVGPRPLLVGLLWLAAVTPRLVEVDLAQHRLPDAIVLPGHPVVLASVVLDRWAAGADALPVLAAAAATGLVLLLLHLTGGLGLGDPNHRIGTCRLSALWRSGRTANGDTRCGSAIDPGSSQQVAVAHPRIQETICTGLAAFSRGGV